MLQSEKVPEVIGPGAERVTLSLSFVHPQALLKHLPCQRQEPRWVLFFLFGFGFLLLVSISFSHIQFF